MDNLVKIAVLDNLCQAQMLEAALKEQGIPNVIRSHNDLVLDGLFQNIEGWGEVEAEEEYRDVILAALEDLKASDQTGEPER